MIGLNPLGETKVWINDNFGMNHPLHEKDPNNDKYPAGDRGIIMNVLDVLKPHFSTGYYRASFFGKVAGCNTIKEAMDFIKVNGGTSTQALEKNKIGLPQKVITLKSSAPPPQVTLPLTTSITQPINTHGQNSFRVNNPPFE